MAISERLGVAEDDALVFFSGSKGLHVGIPSALWEPTPSATFHKTAKRFAEALGEHAGISIDAGVYDRVRIFRAPNSTHPKTGLHKRCLSFDELMHLRPDLILELAKTPEPFEIPEPTYRSEAAAQLWAESAEQVQLEAETRANRSTEGNGSTKLNRSTLSFIRDGAEQGNRHRSCYGASANLAELGGSMRLCEALLSEAALDTGLSPKDVHRAIENGWASAQPGVSDAVAAVAGKVVNVRPAPSVDTTSKPESKNDVKGGVA